MNYQNLKYKGEITMQAITTKYLGPTNHRGSRIKARCNAGSITIPFDYSLNTEGRHKKAAEALIKKLKWENVVILGSGFNHKEEGVHVLTWVKQ
jgi:hypothetical protein